MIFVVFKEILTRLNEIPPEKPGLKRISSRGSAGVQQNAEAVENDLITDELQAELDRQKVLLSFTIISTRNLLSRPI